MRPPLIAALGLAAMLAAVPLVRGEDSAYARLVDMAAAPDDGHVEEGRLPAGADRPLRRAVPPAPPLEVRRVAPDAVRPVSSAAAPEAAPDLLRDAVRDERPVPSAAARTQPTSWVRLYSYLLPSSRSGIPELRASTSAFAGYRPVRRAAPAPYVPHETEEGVRRGMADMMAIMSAGSEPPPPASAR